MHPIRVLIADDHTILRTGLRLLLGGQSGVEVVGEAGDFEETVALARSLRPDVITLDLSMPGGPGLRAIETLREDVPETRVVVLTMHEDPAYVRAALSAGASGFLVKSAADETLIAAVRAVHRGRIFIDVQDSEALDAILSGATSEPPTAIAKLSARERQVMTELARGHTNLAIATQLGLSVKTVESYRARLMQKLGLTSRAELTRLAMNLGLLTDTSREP